MHWSGKLFVWLALILWIGALPLIVKLVKIRSAYHEKLVGLKETTEKQVDTLVDLRRQRRALEADFATTTRGWGNTFLDRDINLPPNPATGEMEIGLGTDDGLGQPDPTKSPIEIHAFRPLPNGEYEYIGPYAVKGLPGGQNSVVAPQWTVIPGEIASLNLQQGTKLRWRELVPTSATIDLSAYNKQLVHHGEELEKRKRDLAREEESALEHEAQLTERMNELVGPPGGEPGLLSKLVEAETERNTQLAKVDELRRKIAAAHALQQELKAGVRDLETELPGATADAGN